MTSPTAFSRRAFTLIELLVVIAILAILMTLLFPAAQGAFDTVKKTQSKNDATQLSAAISGYVTEYGKMPVASGGGTENINDEKLMNMLSGQDVDNLNPRKIVFLEVPRAKAGKGGAEADGGGGYTSPFKDAWGQVFVVMVDDDYDNLVKGPDGSSIRKTVLVWSSGKPEGDKVNADPKKFVKSWE